MSIELRRVRGRAERLAFITMPWSIYKNDPHWVPPLIFEQKEYLDPRRGVFFKNGEAELFLAYKNGEIAGRISAQINHRYDATYKDHKGFFGFFECADDQEVAGALFNAAEDYLRQKGRTQIEGPFNFTVYDEIAVLVDGFDSDPYVLLVHNPPYYDKLLSAGGYRKSVDWFAFRGRAGTIDRDTTDRMRKLRDRALRRQNVRLRPMEMKHFARDAAIVKEIFNDAWDQNWGHVAMTDDEFVRIAKALKSVLIPELSFVLEVDDKPVAFCLCAYDANQAVKKINGRLFPFGFITLLRDVKRTKRFRMLLMGVLKAFRGSGYELAIILAVVEKGSAMGFKEVEMSMVVETNAAMLKVIERLSAERYKTYRVYKKDLGGSGASCR